MTERDRQRLRDAIVDAPRGKRLQAWADLRKATHEQLERDVAAAREAREQRRWWAA